MPLRKMARYTILQDDWGRIFIRNEDKEPVSIEELQGWIEAYQANSARKRVPSAIEHDLLEQNKECYWRGSRAGYVYIVQRANGQVKIGQTGQLKSRIHSLQTTFGQDVHLIHVIRCVDRSGIESALHLMYRHKHIDGEWFDLTPEEIEVIKSRAEA